MDGKKGARKMLAVLARHYPLRFTRTQLGTLAGITASGGTFGTYLSALKRAGFVDEASGDVGITAAGFAQLDLTVPKAPRTPEQVREIWHSALKGGARAMFDELVRAHPKTLTRAELGERAQITASGGTFGTYLSTLRRNGLVDVKGDELRANDALFRRAAR